MGFTKEEIKDALELVQYGIVLTTMCTTCSGNCDGKVAKWVDQRNQNSPQWLLNRAITSELNSIRLDMRLFAGAVHHSFH